MSKKDEMLAMVNQIADKKQADMNNEAKMFADEVRANKRKVKKYAKRIADMVEIANAMVFKGIEIPSSFATDGWNHNFGFICERGTLLSTGVVGVGVNGGGYSYEDFSVDTNGEILSDIDKKAWDRSLKYKCQKMLDEFDMFESRFYEHIKSLTAK